MVDFLSGKVRKTPPTDVPANRYKFLKLQDAEPDLGVAAAAGYILTTNEVGVRTWAQPSSISGFLGSTGFTGSRGLQGFTGSIGFTGSQGAPGAAGGEGSVGFTGSRGNVGFTGSQGVIGFTGSQGVIGFTGSQGVIGFSGSRGFTGSQGVIGFTGSQGIQGFTGSQGVIGFTGSQGVIGFTGSQGFTGSLGFTGSMGPVSGTDGQLIYNNGGISGGANVYFDDTNQRLGIRTASPTRTLHVSTQDLVSSLFQSSTDSSYIDIINSTTGALRFGLFAGVPGISGSQNTTPSITVASNGNIGINTTSISARLDVVGDIEVNSNVNLNSEATTLATVTKTQIASFAVASFRSGKLIVQAYDSVTGEVHISELLVAHNGTTASSTEYGVVYTGANPLAVYDVDISAGNVRLMAQRTTANSTQYKVSETLMVA